MDGNGRWATRQGLPRLAGHRAGIYHVDEVARIIKSRGVRYMTLYMFSTENWRRSKDEVEGIFDLLREWLGNKRPRSCVEGIAPCGTSAGVSPSPPCSSRRWIRRAMEPLDDAALTVCMAINYGGRAEITDAVKHLIGAGLSGYGG